MGKKRREKETIAARVGLILYIAAVSYLCFGRIDQEIAPMISLFGFPPDKVVHFCMFAPFPWIAYLSLGRTCKNFFTALILILAIFIVGCMLAAGTEIVQSYLPYRTCDPKDFKADILSLVINSLLVFVLDLGRRLK